MINTADLDHCREAIRHGSRSFYTASLLLPREVRDPALALYAFCRLADDAVDLTDEKAASVLALRDRLDLAYAGTPRDTPADRAFAAMVAEHDLPRALPDALLEGFAWDAEERRYATIADVHAYSARVASAVGAMMCVLMGVREADALARACDLGVAMQLTNIARDVGEDARAGRLYLPTDWMTEAGIDPDAFLANPVPGTEIASVTRRMLVEADRLYRRATSGIQVLPARCRPGIFAARHIYAGIGTNLRRAGYDNITYRARTSTATKLGLLVIALGRSGASVIMPRRSVLHARPLAETAFLVEAAASRTQDIDRSASLMDIFATLENQKNATGSLS
ncbi:15-cis-phytoene synthase [Pontivivens insulae]|uniref:15-cis-phytoene synthase n=1 Tax=Pontivivens insulae TaxID=1639689 RepID=A0A2R8AA55_9RHOB|nr:phytoene/squalene synthase family protein [Pontivivens insulae]RED12903.1 phytoene synthase [Pontivivens insulae]SPF28995.1 15-cis-phytoene synthase [Pontivivens insulae]